MDSGHGHTVPDFAETARLALEAVGGTLLVLTRAGDVVSVHGRFADALAGPRLEDSFASSCRGRVRAALADAGHGATARLDGDVDVAGARRRWSCTLAPGPDGLVVATCIDVSEAREERRAARRQGLLRDALIEAVSEVVWHFDVAAGYTDRRGWEEFTGCVVAAEDEFGWLCCVHPDDRAGVEAAVRAAPVLREAYLIEYRMRHRGGEWRWVEDHAVPLHDQDGVLTDWVGIVTDVHDRRTGEEDLKRSEQRLRLAIDATGLGIWDVDLETGRREWSPELKEMLGLPRDSRESEEALLACVHPDDRAAVATYNRTAFTDPDAPTSVTFRVVRADSGETRWITSRGRLIVDDSGRRLRRVGTFRDITSTHETRQALRQALKRHEALIAATSEIVWFANADQTAGGGTGWTEFTGQSLDSAEGDGWLQSVHPDDRERARRTAEDALAAGAPYTNEYRLRHVSGVYRWVLDRVVPMRGDDGAVTEWVGIISDIHDRKTAEEAIRRAALTDALTGIANRSLFQSHLDAALDRARAGGEVALVLIDLDRFKEVNDSLGHDAGDHVLRTVADRLRAVVPARATVARLGGDEFGVILPVEAGLEVGRIADDILGALRRATWFAGREMDCSATVGVALFPTHDPDPAALLKNADIALYAAKSAGRGQVVWFRPEMRREMDRRIAVLRNAKEALGQDTIVPFYQPKIDLADGRILGFEALLRWWDGSRLQSVGALAEAFGDHDLSARIGRRMLAKVIEDMVSWTERGIRFGHVALNVAAPEFLQPRFAEHILERLSGAGMPTSCLEVEVTESVLIENGANHVARSLALLDAAGVAISLDDFGTGYASLTHLKKFPVTWLKIDRSFVMNLETESDSAAIVQAVLGMARNIGIRVVAEGVETEWQYDFLRRYGCDAAQGFLLARPMAASRVPHFVATHEPRRGGAVEARRPA